MSDNNQSVKEVWINFIHDLQDHICVALEVSDGKAKFIDVHPDGRRSRPSVIAVVVVGQAHPRAIESGRYGEQHDLNAGLDFDDSVR